VEKLRERKRRKEEENLAVEKQNFSRFRCHRFGTEEPDRPEDDSGLAPEGSSDAEVIPRVRSALGFE
jgi:hypothetical protein